MYSDDSIELPSWTGFRAGAKRAPSTGHIKVAYHGDKISEPQKRARKSLVSLGKTLQPIVLDAIVAGYSGLRKWSRRPPKVTRRSLRELVQLWKVILTKDSHEGVAYVAYVFSCAWDPSGVFVLVHESRVVAVGQSEILGYPIADAARTTPKQKLPSESARKAAVAAARKKAQRNPRELTVKDGELLVTLPAWAGFCDGPGKKPSKGEVMISVGGDAMIDDDAELSAAHRAAFRAVIARAEATQKLLLAALEKQHPKMKPLRDHIALTSVSIHHAERGGVAYVGYQLACDWDHEHALGVMTHGARVVKAGAADVAILGWVAKADAKKKI